MSHALTAALGIVAGLCIAVPLRRWLIRYSETGTPPQPHIGARLYRWEDAVTIPRRP
jgi:hypothetical protein